MKRIIWLLFAANGLFAQAQELITYPVPRELFYSAHNDDYTVRVRVPGGEWQDLYEYNVQVDLDNVQDASMVSFDFSGEVEVSVRKNNGSVNSVSIRPLSYGIIPEVNDGAITFSLDRPRKLSLEVNGDRLHNLHLFANAIFKDVPKPDDPNVIYFGPGLHTPTDAPGDTFHVPSGKTVYLDGGAVVKAKFMVNHAHDVKIIGHGIVFQPERGVEIRYSRNVTVDGPIFINPSHYTIYGGESTGLTFCNIKSFSCQPWSDGISLMSCSEVTIDDVFMRNSDDCIAASGHRWDFYGSARNWQVRNSTLWADVAHPISLGLVGNAALGGDTIADFVFSNIDILEHDEDDPDYQGCMAIACSDNNIVKNITFKDIRIEDFQEGCLFNFKVVYNEKYSDAPGRRIENVLLKDIQYKGFTTNPSIIAGYSEERIVDSVRIEGLRMNGKLVDNLKNGNIQVGKFVKHLSIDNSLIGFGGLLISTIKN